MHLFFNVPQRNRQCTKAGEQFVPGMRYVSILFKENNSLIREDYCEKCWEEQRPKKELISQWKGQIRHKKLNSSEAQVERAKQALILFKEAFEAKREEEAFVLALFLLRERIFVSLKTKKTNVMLVEHVETEEIFSVPFLQLSNEKIASIQKIISEKLNASVSC